MQCEEQIKVMKEQVFRFGDVQIEVVAPAFEIEVDDDAVYPADEITDLLHPKLRKILAATEFKDPASTDKKLQKQLEKQKARMAVKLLQKEWQSYLGEAQVKMTRTEILATIVPGANSKKKKLGVKKAVKLKAN